MTIIESLDDYNKWARERHNNFDPNKPVQNCLGCSECGKELWDSNAMILTSNPPQKNVHCDCGYTGYRVC